jgi:hypothetical protein
MLVVVVAVLIQQERAATAVQVVVVMLALDKAQLVRVEMELQILEAVEVGHLIMLLVELVVQVSLSYLFPHQDTQAQPQVAQQ